MIFLFTQIRSDSIPNTAVASAHLLRFCENLVLSKYLLYRESANKHIYCYFEMHFPRPK